MNIQESFRGRVIEAYGTDKAVSISKKCGIPVSTLQSMLSGSLPRVDNLVALALGANVDVGWLATGEHTVQSNSNFPAVPLYDAEASAGHGSFVDYAPIKDRIPFTEDFLLRRLGRTNADGLICIYARGDSMEPTIGDGDLIMIDTNKKQLTAAIYAFTYEDHLYVKRINNLPGAIKATSDNKEYDPFTIDREQQNRADILGRVVWVGHTP